MGRKKHHILIIDDDPNIRMLLEFVLRKNYRVDTSEDGLCGIAWMAGGNIPDLIILDIEMPRLNGFEFLKAIRESGFYRDIPVIILSGFESVEMKRKSMDLGANDYMVKPFNPEKIQKGIEVLLARTDSLSRV